MWYMFKGCGVGVGVAGSHSIYYSNNESMDSFDDDDVLVWGDQGSSGLIT